MKINYKNFKAYKRAVQEQNPNKILLRIKLLSVVFFIMGVYLYFINRIDMSIAIFIGGMAGIVVGVFYYRLVKSDKITFGYRKP
ncbi:MAG TPA: hypothetical protein VJJ52_04865 [Candidatus Nanoarchaeia archaeon]|nr:hypothetical protein [Candidatus Nanoarchaeia archaeon]